ncbi:MAG: NAD(P)(+) transhydrogenase (Re/Si-specific) subunit alpha [Rickettsiales bacterium]|nr:NAD(P)(+) transhydrogenase (Re/Si-specific) subunit alpha [Rickettsiales bacterium]
MKIAIVKETSKLEKRVAATPDIVKKYIDLGFEVGFEKNAGVNSYYSDESYISAGAKVYNNVEDLISESDIILKVNNVYNGGEGADNIELYKKNKIIIGFLKPLQNIEQIKDLVKKNINAFSVELIPRISRAQSMDALSSQSNLAGYKSVINAVNEFSRAIPMMMTAAGTIAPAKVLVLGAGVAGLQAIATAKRLGGIVSAFDVRTAVKEQVESLGAKFIEVSLKEDRQGNNETESGYAREMSDEYKTKQKELLENHIKNQDIVITTALIPGKKAPELISKEMVKSMKTGSIIMDLAAEAGGNCSYTKANETIIEEGIKIIGPTDLPSQIPQDASNLYAKNLLNFIKLMVKEKELNIDWDDEIIKKSCVSNNGKIMNIGKE